MSDPLPLVFHCPVENVDPGKLATLVSELRSGSDIVAFIYRPDRFVVAMADDAGGFKTAVERDGKTFVEPAGFAEAYEAIVFCEDWELRWVREGLSGTASLLSETPMALDGKKATKIDNVVDKNPISYLVWGKVPEASKPVAKTKPSTPPGWTAVHNSQIGWLLIPATGADEFRLEAMEYFVREEKHGNVAFGFQRLLQFVPGKGGGS